MQGVDGQDKGDTMEVALSLVEHALYLAEMQNVSVSRDAETAFMKIRSTSKLYWTVLAWT